MENINEVMNNENLDEVIFVAEEIVPKTNNGLKIVGTAAGAALVGYGIYKIVKWGVGKIKAKKEKDEIEAICEPAEECSEAEEAK